MSEAARVRVDLMIQPICGCRAQGPGLRAQQVKRCRKVASSLFAHMQASCRALWPLGSDDEGGTP
jgi:hypothetical protein